MADKVMGWDTIGATGFGVLSGPRVHREFTGTDGQKKNIFVPLESIGPEMALLVATLAQADQQGLIPKEVGAEVSGKFLLALKNIAIGSSADGNEFVLSMVTVDNLQLRIKLERQVMELLATAVSAVAKEHGLDADLANPPSVN